MTMQPEANWNPWHGCTKLSEGCRYCYVYRQDSQRGTAIASDECRKTAAFALPLAKKRDGSPKIPSGTLVYTCFTSDFLLPDADAWRGECWRMMKQRQDLQFLFFTKRIERLAQCLPPDWGDGYENVIIGCTCENQRRADQRLPVFEALPIRHKRIVLAPMLEAIDLRPYLGSRIELVICSGESGLNVRPLDYRWVLDIRTQCMEKRVPFSFHQTGAYFVKDGKTYHIARKDQIAQARKAAIDYHPALSEEENP